MLVHNKDRSDLHRIKLTIRIQYYLLFYYLHYNALQ